MRSALIFPGWRSHRILQAASAELLQQPRPRLAAVLLPAPESSANQSARALPTCCSSTFFHAGHVPAAKEDKWGGQAAAQAASAPAVREAAANTWTSGQPLPPICAASSSAALPLPEPGFPGLLGLGFHHCNCFVINLMDFSSIGKNTDFISPSPL